MRAKKAKSQASKAAVRVPSLMVVLLGVVVVNLSCGGVSPATPSQPIETAKPPYAGPSYAGRLLLQAVGCDYSFSGIYELQEGWSEPRKVTDLGFDTAVITGMVKAVSPDRRYLAFAPHFLLDTETGETTALLRPGLTDAEADYEVYGVAFSPDGKRMAYIVSAPRPALFTLEIASKQTRMIHDNRCATYGLYGTSGNKKCEALGDPSWIDANTLVFAHHEGLPHTYTIGSDDDPDVYNHITVATYQGDVVLSTESPPRYEYRATGDTVFIDKHLDGGSLNTLTHARAWLDAADLRKGIDAAHQFPEDGLFILESVSPDGRYILRLLNHDEPQWRLFEVRTGQETILATPGLR